VDLVQVGAGVAEGLGDLGIELVVRLRRDLRDVDPLRQIARAAPSTSSSWPPRTSTRPTRLDPSPSCTIISASWRMTASSASPKRSSSSDSGATRTPEAPLAMRIAVSLVESWPSTLMRSNDRLTVTPRRRSAVSTASAASVWTKQNIVANAGEIIPAPFA